MCTHLLSLALSLSPQFLSGRTPFKDPSVTPGPLSQGFLDLFLMDYFGFDGLMVFGFELSLKPYMHDNKAQIETIYIWLF